MILTANGSRGHHKFTLEVVERVTDDSIATNTTYIDYTFKISPISNNWDWNSWGSKISYRIELGDNVYTGTIPAYDGVSTVTLKYANNVPIVHDSDGTKTISLYFKVTDGANQNYTCGDAEASSTMTLTSLHKPPVINVSSIAERNSALTGISVPNNTVVQYLSTKRFTMSTPTLYDDATIASYTVYHNGIQLGTSSTNKIDANFGLAGELVTTIINNVEYVPIQIVAVDSLNGTTTITKNYAIIKYTRPTIQKTSTNIKRKSPLTDSEGLLNFVGTIYKGNDVVGNANSQQVQYKIWNETEPNYTNINSSQSSGNVTITDYVVNGISYLTAWNYKIKIKDTFTNSDTTVYVKEDRIPTGTAVWTEYKDRVDFISATIGNTQIIESGSNANGEYIKYYDGTMICTKVVSGAEDITTAWGSMYESSAISLGDTADTFTSIPLVFATNQTSTNSGYFIENIYGSSTTSFGYTILARPNSRSNIAYSISLIAIGKWR